MFGGLIVERLFVMQNKKKGKAIKKEKNKNHKHKQRQNKDKFSKNGTDWLM